MDEQELKARLGQSSVFSSPEVMRLMRLDKLCPTGKEKDALSDLSPDQAYTIALYRSFSEFLKEGGIEGGVDSFLILFDEYEVLIMSNGRKGRQEIGGSFGEKSIVYSPQGQPAVNPFTIEDDKPKWWQFWRKK